MYLAAAMATVLIWVNGLLGSAVAVASDPLPNWNDGEVKQGIIEFVARVSAQILWSQTIALPPLTTTVPFGPSSPTFSSCLPWRRRILW